MTLSKGLVGHWTMNNEDTSGGTLYDRSAYDNHAEVNGGQQTDGIIGGAFNFPNLAAMKTSSPVLPNEEKSANLWFKFSQLDGGDAYFFDQETSDGGYQLFYYNDNQEFRIYSANDITSSNTISLDSGEWYMASFSYSSESIDFYLDGESKGTRALDGTTTSDDGMYIGRPHNSQNANITISDLRLYNRALSEEEISALYNMRSQRQTNAKTVYVKDLLLHLNARNKLSVDQSNNRWYDISGNNYEAHGTDGDGSINDDNFPEWEANNGGRFILNGSEGWNVPGPINTSGQVTLETWFYRTDLSADVEYLSDARNGTGQWQLTNYQGYNVNFNNDLEMNDPSGGDYRDTGATSSTSSNLFNRWTHLVATSDGNISEIYIDGEKITDSRLQRDNPFPTGIGKDFAIANRYTGSAHLQGYMSVYRIYDNVLTPAQVKSNYESEKIYYK